MIRLAGGSLQVYEFGPITHNDPGDLGSTSYVVTHNLNSRNVLFDIGYNTTPSAPTTFNRLYYFSTATAFRGIQVNTPSLNTLQLIGYRIIPSTTTYLMGKIWLPS